MNKTLASLLFVAALAGSAAAVAAEPTLHEVYQAANAGKLDDAQKMMREVLQAHPQSGKAHYVEAELLAKQGHRQQAAAELATAEKLAPGLPFANAQSVAGLRQALDRQQSTSAPTALPAPVAPASPAAAAPGLPWGMLLVVLAAVAAFIVWATRLMSRRNAEAPVMTGGGYAQPYPPAAPHSPYSPYAPTPAGGGYAPQPGAPAEPGLGSRVLGGLATGAAVGAGVVAGEALMHRMFDGHKEAPSSSNAFGSGGGQGLGLNDIPSLPSTPLDGLGGNDFGIADGGSWDDGGASGDDDWN